MEPDYSIRRLMLFLFSGSMVLILNILLVISGNAQAFWKNVHMMISMSDYM